jgi:hypothetical protein
VQRVLWVPKADRFTSDNDASFSKKVFNIAMTEIETIVEPDGVGDDIWLESVAFVGIHRLILPILAVNLAIPREAVSFVGIHEPILAISAH